MVVKCLGACIACNGACIHACMTVCVVCSCCVVFVNEVDIQVYIWLCGIVCVCTEYRLGVVDCCAASVNSVIVVRVFAVKCLHVQMPFMPCVLNVPVFTCTLSLHSLLPVGLAQCLIAALYIAIFIGQWKPAHSSRTSWMAAWSWARRLRNMLLQLMPAWMQ